MPKTVSMEVDEITQKFTPKSMTMEMQEVIKLTRSALSKEEFLAAFREAVKLIREHKEASMAEIKAMDAKYLALVMRIQHDYDKNMSAIKGDCLAFVKGEMDKEVETQNNRIKEVESKIKKLLLEIPTRIDKKIKELGADIIKMIPTIEDIASSILRMIPDWGSAIAVALEKLKDGNKLSIDAIQDLREELELAKKSKTVTFGGGGGMSGGHACYTYQIPLASLNGVTKTFTIPAMWRINHVSSSSFPFQYHKDVDYTYDYSANTITFTDTIDASSSLASDQTILIDYAV